MSHHKSAEDIFHELRIIKSQVEQDAKIDEECGDDKQLRERVLSLLRADASVGDFLKSAELCETAEDGSFSTTLDSPNASLIAEKPGTVIGRYKLLGQLGEGGFGIVFVAEQSKPIRRQVALKVIKPGMDSREVLARFEAERQALALMDHPNIAKVFDAGATEAGRPYFVMELVKGEAITLYADRKKLTIRQRLDLFRSVCAAVQHAHQKGIIHRDIKPSNVLITVIDDKPVPKVIDFGIAKATSQKLTDMTLF
ncbi:MAG: serine/threonine protein kinase, partial [Nitrospinae bacterium]|nr:serine/threonine protein kinase [Nitrospinota bacterium]